MSFVSYFIVRWNESWKRDNRGLLGLSKDTGCVVPTTRHTAIHSDNSESNTTEGSKQVKYTLDAIDPKINEKLISIFRLGKLRADGKSRPIKLNFHSADDALYTLKRKSNIPRDKFPNISIKTDLTLRQTEHLFNLREELQRRQQEGERPLTMKYKRKRPPNDIYDLQKDQG
ncbi:hypothetical protein JTB14_013956 [Gonioctena quinquepunctata]|nr:hypothetical protein JTB14_013956 [Gonioctena quinquepunctata]